MLNYCRPSMYTEAELAEDNFRVQRNQKELIVTGKFFVLGASIGLLVSPRVAFADDVAANTARSQAQQELSRRISNTAACSAILTVCGKTASKHPDKVDAVAKAAAKSALTNPQVAAAFGCGFAIAWCAKYAIYDR